MPRAQQSLEERILQHFETAPLGEVRLLHRLVNSKLRARTADAEEQETASPARPRKRKPAAGSGHDGKKKGTSKKKTTPPDDDELPPV